MSYLLPNPILIQDSPFNFNLLQDTSPFKNKFKLAILNQAAFFVKDAIKRRFLPEIPSIDKKQLRQNRSLSKTNTLPLIKSFEPDSEPKMSSPVICKGKNFSFPNNFPKNTQSIRKLNKTFIRHEEEKTFAEDIKIEINSCENIQNEPESPNVIFGNTRNRSHKSTGLFQRNQNFSPYISRSASNADLKEIDQDPFLYSNILKNMNFSSFQCILEGLVDQNFNNFPYYVRIQKNQAYSKIKPSFKVSLEKSPNVNESCKCHKIFDFENSQNFTKKLKLPSLSEYKEFLPSLSTVFKNPQEPKFPRHFIILNFEGTLGSYVHDLCIKPGILKIIKKLSAFFQILLILSTSANKTFEILDLFVKLKIILSGIYLRKENTNRNKEINKLLDYSVIYKDFGIKSPDKEVLIISSHKYIEPIVNFSDVISMKFGVMNKLNIERAPVPSYEYPFPPCTVLLPNYQINQNSLILKKFCKVIVFVSQNQNEKTSVNFKRIFKNPVFCTLKSNAITDLIFEQLQIKKSIWLKTLNKEKQEKCKHMAYCKLHEKFTYTHNFKLTQNLFALN